MAESQSQTMLIEQMSSVSAIAKAAQHQMELRKRRMNPQINLRPDAAKGQRNFNRSLSSHLLASQMPLRDGTMPSRAQLK